MTKNTHSLNYDKLQSADRLELALDHDGNPTWYISTRDGWEEAGNVDHSVLEIIADHFPIGSVVQLYVPVKDAKPELIET